MSHVRQIAPLVLALLLWVNSVAFPAAAQDAVGPRSWPWGSEDQRGAANRMTRASILDALRQVTRGEVVELSHEIAEGAPAIPGVQPPYVFGMYLTAERSIDKFSHEMGATNRIGVNLERIRELDLSAVNELFLLTQPAHLQKIHGTRLSGEQRSSARADIIRRRLSNN